MFRVGTRALVSRQQLEGGGFQPSTGQATTLRLQTRLGPPPPRIWSEHACSGGCGTGGLCVLTCSGTPGGCPGLCLRASTPSL